MLSLLQDVYISKVKGLLGKELNLENGSHLDAVEQNGKANGVKNGSVKEEKSEDVSMDSQEDEEEAVKSPTAPKGKSGRRSKANSDTKSKSVVIYLSSCLKMTETDLK